MSMIYTPLSGRIPFHSSGMQLHCYTAPTSKGAYGYHEYAAVAEQVMFSSAAPGGFAECTFRIYIPTLQVLPPELDIFSRVVISRGADARWIGEIDDSERWIQSKQEFIQIHALGLGNAVRDDVISWVYAAQTVQQIGQHQLNLRQGIGASSTNYWVGVIDPDVSQIFPDNPAGTWSPYYSNADTEEVFQDLVTFASNGNTLYQWGSEAHPTNKDSHGFPTLRMWIRQRDVTTTHFQASINNGEVDQMTFGRNAQYCYNENYILYNGGTGGVNSAPTRDARLNVLGGPLTNPPSAQNLAPFRPRRLMRDYSGTVTVGSSAASAISQAYLNQYSNPSNKGSVVLRAVRDGNGISIPLDSITAGKNILIPELGLPGFSRTSQQSVRQTAPTVPLPGINQFYIVSAQWQEDAQGAYVTLQLDNFVDRAANMIAKLTQTADALARSSQFTMMVIGPGIPDTVGGGGEAWANAASQTLSWSFTWHAQFANQPSSATTVTVSLVNGASVFVNNLSVYGGNVGCSSSASGLVTCLQQITSHGNTLHRIGREHLSWHCSKCDTYHPRLSIAGDGAAVHVRLGDEHDPNCGKPGTSALKVTCPSCGMEEHFNTALGSAHEDHWVHGLHHTEQVKLIRQLMAHPAVGLEVEA